MNNTVPYIASLTREPLLFYEMRTTAKLLSEGLSNQEVVDRIVEENLFQYPTEKSVVRMSKACIKRLENMNEPELIKAIAAESTDVSKQICLYALMKQHRLIWDFMVTVVGEKYRAHDSSFGKIDLNVYFMRLQEQDSTVALWKDSTVSKLKSVIAKTLADTGYIDNVRSEHLNPIWLNSILENVIRSNGETEILPAFNCFS